MTHQLYQNQFVESPIFYAYIMLQMTNKLIGLLVYLRLTILKKSTLFILSEGIHLGQDTNLGSIEIASFVFITQQSGLASSPRVIHNNYKSGLVDRKNSNTQKFAVRCSAKMFIY